MNGFSKISLLDCSFLIRRNKTDFFFNVTLTSCGFTAPFKIILIAVSVKRQAVRYFNEPLSQKLYQEEGKRFNPLSRNRLLQNNNPQ